MYMICLIKLSLANNLYCLYDRLIVQEVFIVNDIAKLRATLNGRNSGVKISIESKRYVCKLELKSKFTRIIGDSGTGKTMLSKVLAANQTVVETSDNYQIVVLTSDAFWTWVNFALRHNIDDLPSDTFLTAYWSDQLNNPYDHCILLIDDEEFVKTKEFAIFFNCDKLNYYICIDRNDLPLVKYLQKEVYIFIADGRHHRIHNTCDTPKNSMEYGNLISVEKDYEKKIISAAEVIRQFECASFYNEDDMFDNELYERWIYFITAHPELSELID